MEIEIANLASEIGLATMVRSPNQDTETIPTEYTNNYLATASFVRQSWFGSKDTRTLKPVFWDLLNDREAFSKWLLSMHRIMCLGPEGKSYYGGKSDVDFDIEKVGRKRGLEDGVITTAIPNELIVQFIKRAGWYGDDLVNKSTLVGQYIAMPDVNGEVSFPGLNILACERYPDFKSGVLEIKSDDSWLYYPPHPQYLDNKLDLMREHLSAAFTALPIDQYRALDNLARYYQVAIRSQFTPGVWNSILTAQVNEFLKTSGFPRVSHNYYDGLALVLSQDNFAQYFKDSVSIIAGYVQQEDVFRRLKVDL